MFKAFAAIAFSALVFGAAPALAGDSPGSCSLESWSDPWDCAAERDSTRLAAYGLDPIRAVAKPGGFLLRVMFSDDYDRPLPAIIVERLPSGGGRMTVVGLFNDGPSGSVFMNMAAWTHPRRTVRVATLASNDMRSLLSEARGVFESPDQVATVEDRSSVCMHPRFATVEVAEGDRWVSRGRNGCDADEVWAFAKKAAEFAVEHLSPCAALDPGNPYYRLQDCLRLTGDRVAAAEVLKALTPRDFQDAAAERAYQLELRAPAVRLEWAGEPVVTGREAEMAAWDRLTKDVGNMSEGRFFHTGGAVFTGISSSEVMVSETVWYLIEKDDSETAISAHASYRWRLGRDHRWRVEEISVGPFTPTKI
ncbi:MAG TPA: hypothetical protein VGL66_01045 [Caulobacteraceae bacterium]|jgi:hypothetical protein